MGHRVDLPEAIREKMESPFGADFSNVKLYESQTVRDAGAKAMTQGTNIAFAPGQLDLASTAGQALLGHELSHVVSQARGESVGQGFLKDAHLESQADRQGMMAAQGESVYTGSVTPIGTSSAVGASGPMQAEKLTEFEKARAERYALHNYAYGLGGHNGYDRSKHSPYEIPSKAHPIQRNKFLQEMNSEMGPDQYNADLHTGYLRAMAAGDVQEAKRVKKMKKFNDKFRTAQMKGRYSKWLNMAVEGRDKGYLQFDNPKFSFTRSNMKARKAVDKFIKKHGGDEGIEFFMPER